MTVFLKLAPFLIEPSRADLPPVEGGGATGEGGATGGGGGAKAGGGGTKEGVGGAWGGEVGGTEFVLSCAAELLLVRVVSWSLSLCVVTMDDLDLFIAAFLKTCKR